MKYFAILLVMAFVASSQALTDEQKAKFKAIHEACVKDTGIDPEIPKKAKAEGVFEDSSTFRNYLLCVHKKIGFQNEKGEIQKDVIKEKLGPELGEEKVNELITKCAIQKPCPHETAFDLAKCAHAYKP